MQTLIGQIDKIIFEDDGFFIAALKDGKKVSGNYYESAVSDLKGAAVTLKGFYEEHKKYGKSFKFESLKVNQNQLFFFLNKVIKTIPAELTSELIEKFGDEGLIDILDNDIEKLLEFKGIKKKRLIKIQERWKQYRSMRLLGEFLTPFGVSPTLLGMISSAFKDVKNPIERIKNNPYVLTNVNGIGFKMADEIALNMGIERESSKRIATAMDYVLNEYCESQGNSCIEKDNLFELLDELLMFTNKNALYDEILVDSVIEDKLVALEHHRYSTRRLYDAEKLLHSRFKLFAKKKDEVLSKDLDDFLKNHSLKLGEQQRQAVEHINSGSKILFLVGYAGTGKSTTAKSILSLLALRYDASLIITCALSGIASQRISERTGYEGGTIQSLLTKFEERDKLPYKVILIDEASMINSMLFARLLAKIDDSATLIVVGDDAQLPPIGAGNVLSDVLTLNLVPIVKLTKIYRQSEDQAIALIANDIRVAKLPQYRYEYEDFSFLDISIENYYAKKSALSDTEFKALREENAEKIVSAIASTAIKYIPIARKALNAKEIGEYLNFFQVITPMRSGTLGVDNLNHVLQEYFNPKPAKKVSFAKHEIRLMDKVVHIKNENMPSFTSEDFKEGEESVQRRIFNGMSGLVFQIDEEEELTYIYYPTDDLVVRYEKNELKNFVALAYALTIHKVQGMEYSVVVMPMSFSHFIMHNTKLLYTAITRAKDMCIIVGESAAFESACRRIEITKRDTILLELEKSKNI